MFSFFHMQEKQILIGNVLVVVCCGFYLAWWLLTFRTSGPVTGVRTGWLLIPAGIAGLVGIILAIRGMGLIEKTSGRQLFEGGHVALGGLAVYFILLAVTVFLLKRPVTSELFLIVGWGVLASTEINALFRSGLFPHRLSIALLVLICAALVVSLVCYILYYRLGGLASYIDGMVPLLLVALVMVVISCFMVARNK